MCLCNLTLQHITDESFSCGQNLMDQVVYRARIIGTDNYSARDLVKLLQSWIGTQSAAITVGIPRLHLDPSCPASMDHLNAPDCPFLIPPTTPTTEPTTPPQVQTTTQKASKSEVRPAEVGGVVIGAAIVVLLLALISLIIVVIVVKWRPKTSISIK